MSMTQLMASWMSIPLFHHHLHLSLQMPLIERPPPSHQNKKMESLLFLSRQLVVLLTLLPLFFPLALMHHVLRPPHPHKVLLMLQRNLLHLALM